MADLTKQVANSSKQAAINVAKKIARENAEVLKSAKSQVLATPEVTPNVVSPQPVAPVGEPVVDPQLEAKINAQSQQSMEKLEAELKQIRDKREQEIKESWQEPPKPVEQPKNEVVNAPGKAKRAIGGMIKRITGKREMQKNVSG